MYICIHIHIMYISCMCACISICEYVYICMHVCITFKHLGTDKKGHFSFCFWGSPEILTESLKYKLLLLRESFWWEPNVNLEVTQRTFQTPHWYFICITSWNSINNNCIFILIVKKLYWYAEFHLD